MRQAFHGSNDQASHRGRLYWPRQGWMRWLRRQNASVVKPGALVQTVRHTKKMKKSKTNHMGE
jgi:hypothetical protein